jgi:predicted mannosyl-3-phosphoglycerate phosphatase (HAD superfamily)
MKQRRIVFLDIDGVLTHVGSNDRLDPTCISRLDDLLTATGAEIVLTSSWRDTYGVTGTQKRLALAGFRNRIIDAVPALPSGTRSDEIDAYLARTEGCEHYVILDDVPVEPRLRRRLVLVDDFVGLTAVDVALATRMLL